MTHKKKKPKANKAQNTGKKSCTANRANNNNKPNKQRKMKKQKVAEEREIRCRNCNVITSRDENSFTCLYKINNNANYYCYRCASIFLHPQSQELIVWFRTGKIKGKDNRRNLTCKELNKKMLKRSIKMNQRLLNFKNSNGGLIASAEDLKNLCYEKSYKCAVTKNHLYFNTSGVKNNPYWSLTFDHINPLKQTNGTVTGWSKNNLQLLCSILNSIKGHKPDEELRSWFNRFISSNANNKN